MIAELFRIGPLAVSPFGVMLVLSLFIAYLQGARAMKFFSSPISEVIGKPCSTFFARREQDGCYFHRRDVVKEFFSPRHPGMPEGDRSRTR